MAQQQITDLAGGCARRHPSQRPPTGSKASGGYPLRPDEWRRGSALIYQPRGASHAVWWLFGPGPTFDGWYVNLECRTQHGLDINVVDLELDLNVSPDRTWVWKDEESFEAKTGDPMYWSDAEAREIRAEGLRVAGLVESGAFPFDGTWCEFTPPDSWTIPMLPPKPDFATLQQLP